MAKSSSSSTTVPAPIAEIDHGPSKLDQFLDAHTKKLIIAAILIALGVIGYVIWDGLAEAKAHEAGSALVTARKIPEYQDVIKKYPDTNSAASAHPLLADLQWADSQPDSIESLREFITKYPEHPALATAKVSHGLRLLAQGKTDDAKETLTEVAESESASYIVPLACIVLGDIAKAANDPKKAKEWYEKAQDDPTGQGNTFKGMAAARLALVNAKPPVKIKPALPEPAKPPVTPGATPPAPPTPPAPAPSAPETPQTPAPTGSEAPQSPQTPSP